MFLMSEAIDISAFTVLGPSLFLELIFVIFIRLNPRSASTLSGTKQCSNNAIFATSL